MKRFLVLLIVGFTAVQLSAAAYDNDRIIDKSNLPTAAQKFIDQRFAKEPISIVKQDKDFMGANYDVIFTNGNKVEFDSKGNWESIDCRFSEVPKAVVPNNIHAYITKTYPNTKILKIEKEDRRQMEVILSNGLELTFDAKGNLADIDN